VRSLLDGSDGTIFTEPADLLAAAPRATAAWIPIGANVEASAPGDRAVGRARWGIESSEEVLAFFGFLNASKGGDRLLEAAALLRERGRPVRVLLLGDETGGADGSNRATAESIRRLGERLGLGDAITRTGWLEPAEVSEALGAADVAVLPYVDGASLRRGSLLACFAHGVPVVATRPAGPVRLPPTQLVAPFLAPDGLALGDDVLEAVGSSDGAAGLADAIERVLDDDGRREQLACGGRTLAARLSWAAIAEGTEALYGRLLGSQAAGRAR
jgi:glycosyltransferase involved in cell wall biosynthesis